LERVWNELIPHSVFSLSYLKKGVKDFQGKAESILFASFHLRPAKLTVMELMNLTYNVRDVILEQSGEASVEPGVRPPVQSD